MAQNKSKKELKKIEFSAQETPTVLYSPSIPNLAQEYYVEIQNQGLGGCGSYAIFTSLIAHYQRVSLIPKEQRNDQDKHVIHIVTRLAHDAVNAGHYDSVAGCLNRIASFSLHARKYTRDWRNKAGRVLRSYRTKEEDRLLVAMDDVFRSRYVPQVFEEISAILLEGSDILQNRYIREQIMPGLDRVDDEALEEPITAYQDTADGASDSDFHAAAKRWQTQHRRKVKKEGDKEVPIERTAPEKGEFALAMLGLDARDMAAISYYRRCQREVGQDAPSAMGEEISLLEGSQRTIIHRMQLGWAKEDRSAAEKLHNILAVARGAGVAREIKAQKANFTPAVLLEQSPVGQLLSKKRRLPGKVEAAVKHRLRSNASWFTPTDVVYVIDSIGCEADIYGDEDVLEVNDRVLTRKAKKEAKASAGQRPVIAVRFNGGHVVGLWSLFPKSLGVNNTGDVEKTFAKFARHVPITPTMSADGGVGGIFSEVEAELAKKYPKNSTAAEKMVWERIKGTWQAANGNLETFLQGLAGGGEGLAILPNLRNPPLNTSIVARAIDFLALRQRGKVMVDDSLRGKLELEQAAQDAKAQPMAEEKKQEQEQLQDSKHGPEARYRSEDSPPAAPVAAVGIPAAVDPVPNPDVPAGPLSEEDVPPSMPGVAVPAAAPAPAPSSPDPAPLSIPPSGPAGAPDPGLGLPANPPQSPSQGDSFAEDKVEFKDIKAGSSPEANPQFPRLPPQGPFDPSLARASITITNTTYPESRDSSPTSSSLSSNVSDGSMLDGSRGFPQQRQIPVANIPAIIPRDRRIKETQHTLPLHQVEIDANARRELLKQYQADLSRYTANRAADNRQQLLRPSLIAADLRYCQQQFNLAVNNPGMLGISHHREGLLGLVEAMQLMAIAAHNAATAGQPLPPHLWQDINARLLTAENCLQGIDETDRHQPVWAGAMEQRILNTRTYALKALDAQAAHLKIIAQQKAETMLEAIERVSDVLSRAIPQAANPANAAPPPADAKVAAVSPSAANPVTHFQTALQAIQSSLVAAQDAMRARNIPGAMQAASQVSSQIEALSTALRRERLSQQQERYLTDVRHVTHLLERYVAEASQANEAADLAAAQAIAARTDLEGVDNILSHLPIEPAYQPVRPRGWSNRIAGWYNGAADMLAKGLNTLADGAYFLLSIVAPLRWLRAQMGKALQASWQSWQFNRGAGAILPTFAVAIMAGLYVIASFIALPAYTGRFLNWAKDEWRVSSGWGSVMPAIYVGIAAGLHGIMQLVTLPAELVYWTFAGLANYTKEALIAIGLIAAAVAYITTGVGLLALLGAAVFIIGACWEYAHKSSALKALRRFHNNNREELELLPVDADSEAINNQKTTIKARAAELFAVLDELRDHFAQHTGFPYQEYLDQLRDLRIEADSATAEQLPGLVTRANDILRATLDASAIIGKQQPAALSLVWSVLKWLGLAVVFGVGLAALAYFTGGLAIPALALLGFKLLPAFTLSTPLLFTMGISLGAIFAVPVIFTTFKAWFHNRVNQELISVAESDKNARDAQVIVMESESVPNQDGRRNEPITGFRWVDVEREKVSANFIQLQKKQIIEGPNNAANSPEYFIVQDEENPSKVTVYHTYIIEKLRDGSNESTTTHYLSSGIINIPKNGEPIRLDLPFKNGRRYRNLYLKLMGYPPQVRHQLDKQIFTDIDRSQQNAGLVEQKGLGNDGRLYERAAGPQLEQLDLGEGLGPLEPARMEDDQPNDDKQLLPESKHFELERDAEPRRDELDHKHGQPHRGDEKDNGSEHFSRLSDNDRKSLASLSLPITKRWRDAAAPTAITTDTLFLRTLGLLLDEKDKAYVSRSRRNITSDNIMVPPQLAQREMLADMQRLHRELDNWGAMREVKRASGKEIILDQLPSEYLNPEQVEALVERQLQEWVVDPKWGIDPTTEKGLGAHMAAINEAVALMHEWQGKPKEIKDPHHVSEILAIELNAKWQHLKHLERLANILEANMQHGNMKLMPHVRGRYEKLLGAIAAQASAIEASIHARNFPQLQGKDLQQANEYLNLPVAQQLSRYSALSEEVTCYVQLTDARRIVQRLDIYILAPTDKSIDSSIERLRKELFRDFSTAAARWADEAEVPKIPDLEDDDPLPDVVEPPDKFEFKSAGQKAEIQGPTHRNLSNHALKEKKAILAPRLINSVKVVATYMQQLNALLRKRPLNIPDRELIGVILGYAGKLLKHTYIDFDTLRLHPSDRGDEINGNLARIEQMVTKIRLVAAMSRLAQIQTLLSEVNTLQGSMPGDAFRRHHRVMLLIAFIQETLKTVGIPAAYKRMLQGLLKQQRELHQQQLYKQAEKLLDDPNIASLSPENAGELSQELGKILLTLYDSEPRRFVKDWQTNMDEPGDIPSGGEYSKRGGLFRNLLNEFAQLQLRANGREVNTRNIRAARYFLMGVARRKELTVWMDDDSQRPGESSEDYKKRFGGLKSADVRIKRRKNNANHERGTPKGFSPLTAHQIIEEWKAPPSPRGSISAPAPSLPLPRMSAGDGVSPPEPVGSNLSWLGGVVAAAAEDVVGVGPEQGDRVEVVDEPGPAADRAAAELGDGAPAAPHPSLDPLQVLRRGDPIVPISPLSSAPVEGQPHSGPASPPSSPRKPLSPADLPRVFTAPELPLASPQPGQSADRSVFDLKSRDGGGSPREGGEERGMDVNAFLLGGPKLTDAKKRPGEFDYSFLSTIENGLNDTNLDALRLAYNKSKWPMASQLQLDRLDLAVSYLEILKSGQIAIKSGHKIFSITQIRDQLEADKSTLKDYQVMVRYIAVIERNAAEAQTMSKHFKKNKPYLQIEIEKSKDKLKKSRSFLSRLFTSDLSAQQIVQCGERAIAEVVAEFDRVEHSIDTISIDTLDSVMEKVERLLELRRQGLAIRAEVSRLVGKGTPNWEEFDKVEQSLDSILKRAILAKIGIKGAEVKSWKQFVEEQQQLINSENAAAGVKQRAIARIKQVAKVAQQVIEALTEAGNKAQAIVRRNQDDDEELSDAKVFVADWQKIQEANAAIQAIAQRVSSPAEGLDAKRRQAAAPAAPPAPGVPPVAPAAAGVPAPEGEEVPPEVSEAPELLDENEMSPPARAPVTPTVRSPDALLAPPDALIRSRSFDPKDRKLSGLFSPRFVSGEDKAPQVPGRREVKRPPSVYKMSHALLDQTRSLLTQLQQAQIELAKYFANQEGLQLKSSAEMPIKKGDQLSIEAAKQHVQMAENFVAAAEIFADFELDTNNEYNEVIADIIALAEKIAPRIDVVRTAYKSVEGQEARKRKHDSKQRSLVTGNPSDAKSEPTHDRDMSEVLSTAEKIFMRLVSVVDLSQDRRKLIVGFRARDFNGKVIGSQKVCEELLEQCDEATKVFAKKGAGRNRGTKLAQVRNFHRQAELIHTHMKNLAQILRLNDLKRKPNSSQVASVNEIMDKIKTDITKYKKYYADKPAAKKHPSYAMTEEILLAIDEQIRKYGTLIVNPQAMRRGSSAGLSSSPASASDFWRHARSPASDARSPQSEIASPSQVASPSVVPVSPAAAPASPAGDNPPKGAPALGEGQPGVEGQDANPHDPPQSGGHNP